ncbi:MAG: amidohydrolase family protein [Proteobacteria bacterium]|nr:amidohydrolase family protein [Pseudomonadota bacterium]
MTIIDPHHHLWDLSQMNYPWLEEADKTAFFGDYGALAKNYQTQNYLVDTAGQDVIASVHIQADADPLDPVAETRWLSEVAQRSGELGGISVPNAIVAYADFTQDDIDAVLASHCQFDRVRGIRQILNYHEDDSFSYTSENFLDNPCWQESFSLLKKYRLSFDLQIYYQQMEQAAQLADKHPETQIILNHTGMPVEHDSQGIEGWRKGMARLAQCPNVVVKISGLGMCIPDWTIDRIRPFVMDTIDRFGVERCMFASNFPVDSLFGTYESLYNAYHTITSGFSVSQKSKLFCDNAARYYQL